MMILLAVLLLCQDPAADVDRLVRDLGHEFLEVRERAQAKLLVAGTEAIVSLRRALSSEDAEVRLRAETLLETVERPDRERAHDADQKAALLLENRTLADTVREGSPGAAVTEGARFKLTSTAFNGGWVIATGVTDYLARRSDPGPGSGLLRFDVQSITDAKGNELTIERCGRCSPKLVFVRRASGTLKVRLKGDQTWFSPYSLEFKDPAEGHSKRIGNYTIEVRGFSLKVSSPSRFPKEWIRSMNTECSFELKPGIEVSQPQWIL